MHITHVTAVAAYTHVQTSNACLSIIANIRQNMICTCFTSTLAPAAKKHAHKGILAPAASCGKGDSGCTEAAGIARPDPDVVLGDLSTALSTSFWRISVAKESK